MSMWSWIVEAVKHPRELSTIFPSSPFLARTIADQIDFDEPVNIAELGAGDGALTGPLVERMKPGSNLLLIEVNEQFCDELRKKYADHPKSDDIKVLQRGAEELPEICEEQGINQLDYAVSGLPLTTLPDDLSEQVIQTTFETLKPGGRYVQFQYSQDYKENIEDVFGPVKLERVWLNVFPAWVYAADKNRT